METGRTVFVIAAIFGLLGSGCTSSSRSAIERLFGAPGTMGQGTAASFAEFDRSGAPKAIGVVFSGDALESLPEADSDGHRCFDANGDGVMDLHTECSAWHEWVLPLPSQASVRQDIPFKWALVNWNPHGHIPEGAWDVPHIDVHFYIERIEKVFSLERGPCGPEFLRCDQFELATRPVPPNYMHPDYDDVGAAAPAMGNHLIDQSTPEFHGEPFTRHWIYGIYDGEVIFYEEMVALNYLLSRPNKCYDIKMPEAVALTGFYPTRACVRYEPERNEYAVSMEDFIMREASPPQPIPAAKGGAD